MPRPAGLLRVPAAVLLSLTLLACPRCARPQDIEEDPAPRALGAGVVHHPRLSTTARLQRAAAASDTTWIGHAPTGPYSAGPYHVGTGPNHPGSGNPNGFWDWDTFAPGENDSLQGWWPMRRTYNITGGLTLPDTDRPWWAVEHGNIGNYVLDSQHQSRTVGVMSYWHVDDGNAHPGPANAITWTPIHGSGSAWCGLRAHGDLAFNDPITGNPYNQTVLEFQGESGAGSGTSKHFPGYTSQMDQMLYRDVELTSSGATLDLSFSYRTAMSTLTTTASATRTGWFVYDPSTLGGVAVTGPMSGAPNFVKNTGTGTPADSFLVYLGVPVNLDAVYTADGTLHVPDSHHPHGVYDVYRRWLSEVIALDKPVEKVLAVGGNTSNTFALSGKSVAAYYNAQSGPNRYLRIVFRVHTNAGSSDLLVAPASFTSGGAGAALIDDVVIGGSEVSGGGTGTTTFDSPAAIDNSGAGSGLALGAWIATGKPPRPYTHTHPLSGGDVGSGNVYDPLMWQDLCGPPGSSPNCNMLGVVLSMGNHDDDERIAGGLGGIPSEHEALYGIMSPTLNLMSTGSGDFNAQGIDADIAYVADDIYLQLDVYTGALNLFSYGVSYVFGAQSYPSVESNGPAIKCWGELRVFPGQVFNNSPICARDINGLYGSALIKTSNGPGVPDSLRVFIGVNQQCFRFGVTPANCNVPYGVYFDNVSVGINNGTFFPAPTPAVAVDPWRWLHDAFPANDSPTLPGTSAFDTCAALIKTGFNSAQSPGDANRFDIPADSVVVQVDEVVPERVDMIFRILPGPGNYHTAGNRSSGLRPAPTDGVNVVSAGDGSFWGQYMSTPGAFASAGAVAQHAAAPSGWGENVWNSARCDTNTFGGWRNESTGSFLELETYAGPGGGFVSTYEESDPHFNTLGISRRLCFQNNPAGTTTSSNLVCNGTLPGWVTAGAGYDAAAYNPPNQTLTNSTQEGTKILPDGLLTPGSHVEYFFVVRELSNLSSVAMIPDTHFVTPQLAEGSSDGHRWQEFSVLPDRWKASGYGGDGLGCMLVVDLADGSGDERAWVSAADSACLTQPAKRGAHNGWRARADQVLTNPDGTPVDVSGDPTIAVYTHGGAPGTTWDLYGVRGMSGANPVNPSGRLGSRYAPTPTGLATGKGATIGPTVEMLDAYYSALILLTGSQSSGVLGPFINCGANDVQVLSSWLSGSTPRELYVAGSGFVQSEYTAGLSFPTHQTLLQNMLGTTLRIISGSPAVAYRTASGDLAPYTFVTPTTLLPSLQLGTTNDCTAGADVLDIPIVGPQPWSYYGSGSQYLSGVRNAPAGMPYESIVEGFDFKNLMSPYGENTAGRSHYLFELATWIFARTGCAFPGDPCLPLGGVSGGPAVRDQLSLRNTPLRSGWATVHLGLAHADRVRVRIYDIAGRQVRTLADRSFDAGEYDLRWDGTDDAGGRLSHGVYFARATYASSGFIDARRIVVLR